MKLLLLSLIFLVDYEILANAKITKRKQRTDESQKFLYEGVRYQTVFEKLENFVEFLRNTPTIVNNIYKKRETSTRDGPTKVPLHYDAAEEYPYCESIETITEQGYCASCWAIAVVSAFSDRICIHSKGERNYHMSVQQMIACDKDNKGCWGGDIYTAWKFLENFPLVTGGLYGSAGEEKGCQPYLVHPTLEKSIKLQCSREDCPITHKAKDIIALPKSEYEIQREIMNYGPVSATMTFYASFFNYTGGVYRKKRMDAYLGPHFVRIIGWGETKETEEKPKLKYWICTDSRSIFWGEYGTFRILRGVNECGIESHVVSGLPDFYTPPKKEN